MISPWVIYMISVLNSIRCFSGVVFVISLFYVSYLIASYLFWDNRHERCIWSIVIGALVISASMKILTPPEQTMYAMLVANYLTPENVEILRSFGVETVQQLGDVIADSIGKAMQKGR